MSTDWKTLCAELAQQLDDALDFTVSSETRRYMKELTGRARAALAAEADGPAVPEDREPASVVGEPSDEEIMELMTQQMHDDLAAAVRAMAEQEGIDSTRAKGVMRIMLNRHVVDLARAVLARFGHQPAPPAAGVNPIRAALERLVELDNSWPMQDGRWAWKHENAIADSIEALSAAPPAAGEVGELVEWLREKATWHPADEPEAALFDRAADLLEQRHPTPVPVASDTYFEFIVSDADDCTQAGGIAPTYAQALSEGQHYFAQYQQDAPHTLEVRRVEILPLPQGEVAE